MNGMWPLAGIVKRRAPKSIGLRGNRGDSSGSHPQAEEKQEFSYSFFSHLLNGEPPMGRWCEGQSIDGKGQFDIVNSEPMGQKPVLNPARPSGGAQAEQI